MPSTPFIYLAISLVALAAGPLIVKLARRAHAASVIIDAFVLVVVVGLVALHVLPESLELAGWLALIAAIVGAALPILAERGLRPARGTRGVAIAIAFAGLAAHAMMDGAAVAQVNAEPIEHVHAPGAPHDHDHAQEHGDAHGGGMALAVAVIAHRVPEGIAIWWIAGRMLGTRIAIAMLAWIFMATIAGFLLGAELMRAPAPVVGVFQGLLAGSLLHVLLHAHVPAPAQLSQRARHLGSVAGALAAVAVVWVVESGHSHDHGGGSEGPGAAEVFMALALETAPVLLLAYLVAGLAHAFAPRRWIEHLNRGSTFGQALRGVLVGLPLPVCSCGVVPLYRGLVARGTSAAAAIAFLIATPELEIAAIFLTVELLGPEVAVARLATATVLALSVGVIVGAAVRRAARAAPAAELPGDELVGKGFGERLRHALKVGFVDMIDQTSPWLLVGIGLSAMLAPYLDPTTLAGMPALLAVPVAAALGMPLYVCASGSTPLAAVLVAGGLSPGAALAFLLTGPATNVTTFGVVAGVHGRRIAALFAVAVFAGATALGLAVDALIPRSVLPAVEVAGHHDRASPLATASLVVLALLVLGSLLRRGTRGYVESLFDVPKSHDGHDHAHGHAHDHDHADGCCHS